MDEFVFRTSRALEQLQLHASIAAQGGKEWLSRSAADGATLAQDMWRSASSSSYVQELLQGLLQVLHRVKYSLVAAFDASAFGTELSRRYLLYACTGFVAGSCLGYYIGQLRRKKRPVVPHMKAVVCTGVNGLESCSYAEDCVSPEVLRPDELLVRVSAASVQVVDAQICHGYGRRLRRLLNAGQEYPWVLGRDCVGAVLEVGTGVSRFEPGDEVWLTTPFWAGGALAELVVAPEQRVGKKPAKMKAHAAASLPYAGSLALRLLAEARLSERNALKCRVLVQGGVTPVGCLLVQLLSAWGAVVTATCAQRAAPVLRALGVHDVILTGPRGGGLLKELEARARFDRILLTSDTGLSLQDLQRFSEGGAVANACCQPLESDGYGWLAATVFWAVVKFRCLLEKRPDNFGEPHMCYTSLDELASLCERNLLQTVVDKVYYPGDAEQALAHIQSADSIGSTILTFASSSHQNTS